MKNRFTTYLLLLLTLSGLSCSSGSKDNTNQPTVKDEYQLHAILHGAWLPLGFTEKLALSKSVSHSIGRLSNVSELLIDSTNIMGHQVKATGVWDNYEPMQPEFYIHILESGKVVLEESSLGLKGHLEKVGNDYLLVISDDDNMVSKLKRVGDPKQFEQAQQKKKISLVNYYINDMLFEGNYQLGSGDEIAFHVDGKVDGMTPYTDFTVQTTFPSKSEPFDVVTFNNEEGESSQYIFSFEEDKLVLKKVEMKEVEGDSEPYYELTELNERLVMSPNK